LGECLVLRLEMLDIQMHFLRGIYTHSPPQWTMEIYLILQLLLHIHNILYKYPKDYTNGE